MIMRREIRRAPWSWLFIILLSAPVLVRCAPANGEQVGVKVATALGTGVGKAIGEVVAGPVGGDVGAAVAEAVMAVVTSAFFSTDSDKPTPEETWNSIKGYAESFMTSQLQQQKLQALQQQLVGITSQVNEYAGAFQNKDYKLARAKAQQVAGDLTRISGSFVSATGDSGLAVDALPFLAAYGTIHLGVLQSMAVIYQNSTDKSFRKDAVDSWNKYYNIYVTQINKARAKILNDRIGYIYPDGANDQLLDTYNPPILPGGKYHHQAGSPAARHGETLRAFAQYVSVSAAVGELDVKLNKLLAPMLSWNLLAPANVTAPGTIATKRVLLHTPIYGLGGGLTQAGVGGDPYDGILIGCQIQWDPENCMPQPDRYVTSIAIAKNGINTVNSIYLRYSDGTKAANHDRGVPLDPGASIPLQCGPKEYINQVEGHVDSTVDALKFTTNRGKYYGFVGDWRRGDYFDYVSTWLTTPRHPVAPMTDVMTYSTGDWIEAIAIEFAVYLDFLTLNSVAKDLPKATDPWLNATAPYY